MSIICSLVKYFSTLIRTLRILSSHCDWELGLRNEVCYDELRTPYDITNYLVTLIIHCLTACSLILLILINTLMMILDGSILAPRLVC